MSIPVVLEPSHYLRLKHPQTAAYTAPPQVPTGDLPIDGVGFASLGVVGDREMGQGDGAHDRGEWVDGQTENGMGAVQAMASAPRLPWTDLRAETEGLPGDSLREKPEEPCGTSGHRH